MLHDILIVFSKCKLMYLMIPYRFNHIIRPWQAGHPKLINEAFGFKIRPLPTHCPVKLARKKQPLNLIDYEVL